jgi:hypothetical protein
MRRTSIGAAVVGVVAGALIVRLVALLFAARPDHPLIALWLTITAPLTAPFSFVDRLANQPRFGARLELATLVALGVLIMVALGVGWWRARRQTLKQEDRHA